MRRKEKHCLNILEPQGDFFDNSTKCDASKQVWRMESCTVKCIGEFTSKGSQPKGCWMSVAWIEVLSSRRIWRDTLKEEEDKSGWLVNNSWERSSAEKWTHCTFGPFFSEIIFYSTKAHNLFFICSLDIKLTLTSMHCRDRLERQYVWNLKVSLSYETWL